MAGLWERTKTVFRVKSDRALSKLEDPREQLDYAYQRQLELLTKVRRGVADVAASRKRVELQGRALEGEAEKLTLAAQKALEVGREDLAREALERKSGLADQLRHLDEQHALLMGEEEKLLRAKSQLERKVEEFRTRKETIKASYTAAEAQVRVQEAFAGMNSEFGDVGVAIEHAEDRTAQLQARASAVDELIAMGALGSGGDDVTRELDRLAADSRVEQELGAMKSALAAGQDPRIALEGGGPYENPPKPGAPRTDDPDLR